MDECAPGETKGESSAEASVNISDGGMGRAPSCSQSQSSIPDEDQSDDDKYVSGMSQSSPWITAPTDVTGRPSFNPPPDPIPHECASYVHGANVMRSDPECPRDRVHRDRIPRECATYGHGSNVMRSDPECPFGRARRGRGRFVSFYREPSRERRGRSPTSMGPDGAGRRASIFTRAKSEDVEYERNPFASAPNGGIFSRDYPLSYRSSPYVPLAESKAAPKGIPSRDPRWGIIRDPP